MSYVTDTLLNDRAKTHGSFHDNSRIAQSIKTIYRAEPSWENMTDVQREALDMIACKLSRILSGQAWFEDHWSDVSGYAHLAAEGNHK